MSFYRWMLKKHFKDKTPVGDLARDMKTDAAFPRKGSREEIENYLDYECGACSGCMEAFRKAWAEYEGEND